MVGEEQLLFSAQNADEMRVEATCQVTRMSYNSSTGLITKVPPQSHL